MKKSLFFRLHSVVNQISLAWPHCVAENRILVRSPWSDKKVSGRAGHNSVALPTAKVGGRVTEYALPWRRLSCHSKETFILRQFPGANKPESCVLSQIFPPPRRSGCPKHDFLYCIDVNCRRMPKKWRLTTAWRLPDDLLLTAWRLAITYSLLIDLVLTWPLNRSKVDFAHKVRVF